MCTRLIPAIYTNTAMQHIIHNKQSVKTFTSITIQIFQQSDQVEAEYMYDQSRGESKVE